MKQKQNIFLYTGYAILFSLIIGGEFQPGEVLADEYSASATESKERKNSDPPCRLFSRSYRFPEVYNTNAVAGRLYLQPIGPNEDRVVRHFRIDLSLGTAAEYLPKFNNAAKSYDPMRYNTTFLVSRLSKGYHVWGHSIEVGGVFRFFQDRNDSFLARFLREFHRIIGSDGHIPGDDVPYGAVIGNGYTSVIKGEGNIYVGAPDFYTKLQLLEEGEGSSFADLSIKFSVRLPWGQDDFDTWGAGFSTGFSRQVFEKLRLAGAMALVYQDLSPKNFNATDLKVDELTYDVFCGVGYDFGSTGGYYSTVGLRYSSKRVIYSDNPDSATDAVVVHGALNYISRNGNWEIFSSFGEEITAISRALEPDFLMLLGISWILR